MESSLCIVTASVFSTQSGSNVSNPCNALPFACMTTLLMDGSSPVERHAEARGVTSVCITLRLSS